jgi:hypothetical protein
MFLLIQHRGLALSGFLDLSPGLAGQPSRDLLLPD